MRPQRPFIMPFDTRLATRKPPLRLASMTSMKSSSLMRRTRPSLVMPALETRISTGPSFSSTSDTAASTDAESVTSACTTRRSSLSSACRTRCDGDLVAGCSEPLGDGVADPSVSAGDENAGAHHVTTTLPQAMPAPKPLMSTTAPGSSTPPRRRQPSPSGCWRRMYCRCVQAR